MKALIHIYLENESQGYSMTLTLFMFAKSTLISYHTEAFVKKEVGCTVVHISFLFFKIGINFGWRSNGQFEQHIFGRCPVFSARRFEKCCNFPAICPRKDHSSCSYDFFRKSKNCKKTASKKGNFQCLIQLGTKYAMFETKNFTIF